MIEDRLRELNVYPASIEDDTRIFAGVEEPEDMGREMRARGIALSAEQYLYFQSQNHWLKNIFKAAQVLLGCLE